MVLPLKQNYDECNRCWFYPRCHIVAAMPNNWNRFCLSHILCKCFTLNSQKFIFVFFFDPILLFYLTTLRQKPLNCIKIFCQFWFFIIFHTKTNDNFLFSNEFGAGFQLFFLQNPCHTWFVCLWILNWVQRVHNDRIIASKKWNRKMFMDNKARWHDVYTPNDGLLALLLFICHVEFWFGNFPDHFHSSVAWWCCCGACAVCVSFESVLMCYEKGVYESIMSLAVDGNEMHVIFCGSMMLGMAWCLVVVVALLRCSFRYFQVDSSRNMFHLNLYGNAIRRRNTLKASAHYQRAFNTLT